MALQASAGICSIVTFGRIRIKRLAWTGLKGAASVTLAADWFHLCYYNPVKL
jgi:hypothetical protein